MGGRDGAVLPSRNQVEIAGNDGVQRYSYLPWVDLISAGVPCQDVSVAGKRAGLKGERTGLFYEFARILQELRPTWFVFENVPGLLSSNNGRDFAEVLRVLMVECGYGVCWRVLNSQYFGVAQRRRRVFIVGRFGKPCPPEVLFEREGGSGDIAEGGETGADVAYALAASVRGTGDGHGNGWNSNYAISPPLTRSIAKNFAGSGSGNDGIGTVAFGLSASAGHHRHSSPRGDGGDNLVAATLPADHRFTTDSHVDNLQPIVQQAISSKWAKGSSRPAGDEHHNLIAIQDVRGGTRDRTDNGQGIGIRDGREGMYTLGATEQHGVAISSNPEHQERSCQQLDPAREVDGAMRGDDHECAPPDTNRMREFAGLPAGLDSARYRALGNAVTVQVARWIGERIMLAGGQSR